MFVWTRSCKQSASCKECNIYVLMLLYYSLLPSTNRPVFSPLTLPIVPTDIAMAGFLRTPGRIQPKAGEIIMRQPFGFRF